MGEMNENRNCDRIVRELMAARQQFKLRNADPDTERDYLRKQLGRMTELVSDLHRRIAQLEAAKTGTVAFHDGEAAAMQDLR